MQERPVRAYPERYSPSDLDFGLDVCFEGYDGRVRRIPEDPLVAGDCGTWRFRFENRACDLGPGAVIHLIRFNYQIAFALQMERSGGRDYATVETEGEARLRLIAGPDAVNLFSVRVEGGVFRKGEACTVRAGDRRRGGAGSEVFWSTTVGTFLLAVDVAGDGRFQGVRGNPLTFRVVAHPEPRLLRLLGPTVARTGEPFAMHLGVFDRNGNLIEDFEGEVAFDPPEGVEGLPETYRFTPEDRGLRIFEGVCIQRPGVTRVGVRGVGVEGVGNPTRVEDVPERYVYWGDVHAHGWGDSTMFLMHRRTDKLDPASRHAQGRRIGRFDFACPGAMSMDPEGREEVWEAYREACARTDEPGRYVPFLAYEAHPKAGDRQVIFRDYRDEPTPPGMRLAMEELDRAYGGRDDVFLEVHIGGDPPHWDLYRPARERFVEVCSGFGCAEWLLQRALRLGYRPAVCGASDLHLGLMGGPRAVETFRGRFGPKYPMRHRDSAYGQGPVTAVVAPALTRDRLWEAIEERQTFATSGARIDLRVTCDGVPAGAEVDLGSDLRVGVACHACAPLARVDLIAGEYRVRSWHPGGLDFEGEAVIPAEDLPGGWVYVRAQQADGEYAWSSPVWLRREGPPPPGGDLPRWNEEEVDLDSGGENGASRYLPDLMQYLKTEEDAERFQGVTPAGILDLSMGRCALFFCRWGDEGLPMSIRWFFEFDIPKVRYDLGRRDYGAYDEMDLGPGLMAKYRERI